MTENHGSAGASAFREYERRNSKDAAAIEARKHEVRERLGGGRFGAVAAAVTVDSRTKTSTEVWQRGAIGEVKVGRKLDELRSDELSVLHDRRIPRSCANIDHLVITRAGVWVIDTKRYVGKRPERYVETRLFSATKSGLRVGGRKHDALVDGVLRQVGIVQAALGPSVPVRGLMCFVDADWPLFGGSFSVRGVRVTWPNRLARELKPSPEAPGDVSAVLARVAAVFRPA